MDYRALPRVVQKTVVRSMGEWWKRVHGLRLLLPEGGSTLTQQLVRGYFLQDLTSRVDRDALFHVGLAPPRLLSVVLGAPATNKLLRTHGDHRGGEDRLRRHNRPLGGKETGGRTALPIFREIMLRIYSDQLVGPAPRFPRDIEDGINQYLAMQAVPEVSNTEGPGFGAPLPGTPYSEAAIRRTRGTPSIRPF